MIPMLQGKARNKVLYWWLHKPTKKREVGVGRFYRHEKESNWLRVRVRVRIRIM